MVESGIFIEWNIIIPVMLGVGVPLIGGIFYLISAIIKKEKEWLKYKTMVDTLIMREKTSSVDHQTFNDKNLEIENKLKSFKTDMHLMNDKIDRQASWLRLILNQLKIIYPKD